MAAVRSLPGFESPAAGFDEPFEMLSACHDRVRRTLRLLVRLCGHLLEHGVDEQAREAAKDIRRYFVTAAPLHHQDEELHVVPLLQASSDPQLTAAAERVLADHERMGQAWRVLDPLLNQVVAGECPDSQTFATAIAVFVRLYDDHLALEEDVVFPCARAFQAARDTAALAEMGAEMARRRLVAS